MSLTLISKRRIERCIESSNFKIPVTASYEKMLLGTSRTLAKHIDALSEDDSIAMHSDNFFESSLNCLIDIHLNNETLHLGSLAKFRTTVPSETGINELNSDGSSREFCAKARNPPGNLASAANMML